jgi:hypothetical protein
MAGLSGFCVIDGLIRPKDWRQTRIDDDGPRLAVGVLRPMSLWPGGLGADGTLRADPEARRAVVGSLPPNF